MKCFISPALLYMIMFVSVLSCCSNTDSTPTKVGKAGNEITEKNKVDTLSWEKLEIKLQPPNYSYKETCNHITTKIKSINELDSLSLFFTEALLNQIIPYWYGTAWDFNGYTNIPNQGKIACGYFVSTTLKHIGLNLNRYSLAQQLPINEAKTLSLGEPVIKIICNDFSGCLKSIKEKTKEGFYFIGLDANHVGFLLKRKNHLFFIHSNYSYPQEVIIERAKDSEVLNSFSTFYLSKISNNINLLKYWKKNKRIPTVTK